MSRNSNFHEYDQYDGLGLAGLIQSGEISASEVLEEAIDRMERLNPTLNVLVEPLYEQAKTRARNIDITGIFSGVPFLMKDLGHSMSGIPQRNGSRFFKNFVPNYNSEIVNRFQESGFNTFGTTNTPELGLVGTTEPELYGPTRNPWGLDLTAGGSSGGSAAAVASGIVPIASGSDGGGSIRIPASCCGLVGLKPSRGRNPSGPTLGEGWYGQVQNGVVSKTVRDTAAVLDGTNGTDPGAPYYAPNPSEPYLSLVGAEPSSLRIAVIREGLCSNAPLHPECLTGLDRTVGLLTDLGHRVIEEQSPLDPIPLASSFLMRVVACTSAEIKSAENVLGRKSVHNEFETLTRAFANLSKSYSSGDLTIANRFIESQMRILGRFMLDYDVMLTPTLATAPPKLGVFQPKGLDLLLTNLLSYLPIGPLAKWTKTLERLVENNFTFVVSTMVANMSGEPSISLPLYWDKQNVPVGMMFTSPLYQEDTLLRLAGQIEIAAPWINKKAPCHATNL